MNEESLKGIHVCFTGREKCLSGHFFGPARRPHYLMHVVMEGKGFYEAGSERYELEKGSAFLIYPEEITYYQADENNPWEYVWVAFEGYEVSQILSMTGFGGRRMVCTPKDQEAFLRNIENLHLCFRQNQQNELKLVSLFYQVMAETFDGKREVCQSYEKKYYEKALGYINDNYTYPLKISDVARFVGIDRTYLYKIFMEMRKQSPKQYLLMVRLDSAKRMLTIMDISVTEAAYSCGFKDGASFCSHFKKYFGMTPSQYKKGI